MMETSQSRLDLLTPDTPLTTDNHSTPPDVTGLSERSSLHGERLHVASVRGVSLNYNHHTSVMETADGEFPSSSHTCTHKTSPRFSFSLLLSVPLSEPQSVGLSDGHRLLTAPPPPVAMVTSPQFNSRKFTMFLPAYVNKSTDTTISKKVNNTLAYI